MTPAGTHYVRNHYPTPETDAKGRIQPSRIAGPDPERTDIEDGAYPWNTQGYGNNAYRPLGISVTAGIGGA